MNLNQKPTKIVSGLSSMFSLWALLIMVWLAGRGELELAVGLWVPKTTVGWVVRTVVFFAWVLVFSNLLASHSMNLLRLYEGYWSFPGSGPKTMAVSLGPIGFDLRNNCGTLYFST